MAHDLWAISCFFDPVDSVQRKRNYRLFRESLSLPLAVVELAFDAPFFLGKGDAEILIQVRGGSRLWQKERLLNMALHSLPEECQAVAWVDADLLFPDPAWSDNVLAALELHPVLQPFSEVRHLVPQSENAMGECLGTNGSIASAICAGGRFGQIVSDTINREFGRAACGHAWAARRRVLAQFGLYDGCIVGGGDTAFAGAAFGEPQAVVRAHHMGPHQARRYAEWAKSASGIIGGNVGFVPGTVSHLWHGELFDRRGSERHLGLSSLGFDPYGDLTPHPSGAWSFAEERPDLAEYVERYFVDRKEDGPPSGDGA